MQMYTRAQLQAASFEQVVDALRHRASFEQVSKPPLPPKESAIVHALRRLDAFEVFRSGKRAEGEQHGPAKKPRLEEDGEASTSAGASSPASSSAAKGGSDILAGRPAEPQVTQLKATDTVRILVGERAGHTELVMEVLPDGTCELGNGELYRHSDLQFGWG